MLVGDSSAMMFLLNQLFLMGDHTTDTATSVRVEGVPITKLMHNGVKVVTDDGCGFSFLYVILYSL